MGAPTTNLILQLLTVCLARAPAAGASLATLDGGRAIRPVSKPGCRRDTSMLCYGMAQAATRLGRRSSSASSQRKP